MLPIKVVKKNTTIILSQSVSRRFQQSLRLPVFITVTLSVKQMLQPTNQPANTTGRSTNRHTIPTLEFVNIYCNASCVGIVTSSSCSSKKITNTIIYFCCHTYFFYCFLQCDHFSIFAARFSCKFSIQHLAFFQHFLIISLAFSSFNLLF